MENKTLKVLKIKKLDPDLEKKLQHLGEIIINAESVLVAFSGGVDSTFLARLCHLFLEENVLAVTARSATFPKREQHQAEALATKWGMAHQFFDSSEVDLAEFAANPPDRCFFCKQTLFSQLKQIAVEKKLAVVFDGSNADDCDDFRPGRMAAKELCIRSPLEDAGLTKNEIRAISKAMELPTWDKPAAACLASRFPYYAPITKVALNQVEKAEDFLWELGFRVYRVRHHDTIARLELGPVEMESLWDYKDKIVVRLKALGYLHVAVDLQGYRTGSMNEAIKTT
jgi:pyridinium-3,5-biscarboxylic acid mononucleotide sulfurtransferase